jgi:hypothetical protein
LAVLLLAVLLLAVLLVAVLLLAVLLLAVLVLGVLLFLALLAEVVFAALAVPDPVGADFFDVALFPAGADLAAGTRRFEESALFLAAVGLPAAAFADVVERPAMATALCPRSWTSARSARPERPRGTRGPAENRGVGHFVHA